MVKHGVAKPDEQVMIEQGLEIKRPSEIFVRASLRDLENYAYWTFPPPPHEAHVRYIAADARVPGEILLGVEEGGVLRSRDYGASWEDISGPPSRQTKGPSRT